MSVETVANGRYTVERVLGRGGMAIVYLAQDKELGRPVAIKVLADNLSGDADFRDRFVREAQLAARLSHPSVVSVYDAGEEGGRPYIVTEYVPGVTLADELHRVGRLEAGPAVDLMLQVCGGLAHAHALGLVHRDVKPGNLLLRLPERILKIADFGIARAADTQPMTEIGTILGTAAYLAPEQAAGEPVTQTADIYSLGAVLYETLTGRAPYGFGTMSELLTRRERESIPPVRDLQPDVPAELENVVMRCLARDPAFRPQAAEELAEALAGASPEPPTQPVPRRAQRPATAVTEAFAHTPVHPAAPAVTTRRQLSPGPGRRRGLAAGAAALLVLALLFALVLSSGGDPARQSPPQPLVEAPPPAKDPADEARNLAEWLRQSSG